MKGWQVVNEDGILFCVLTLHMAEFVQFSLLMKIHMHAE